MIVKITVRRALAYILSVLLAASATLASLYYLLSGYMQLGMTLLMAIVLFLPLLSNGIVKNIKITPIVLVQFLMVIFACIKNAALNSQYKISTVILFCIAILLVWLVEYQDFSWLNCTLKISRKIYIFYALYTIAMYFIPALFDFTLYLFPDNVVNLTRVYNNGCMPGLTNHYSTNGMVVAMATMLCGCAMIYDNKKWKHKIWTLICLIALLLTGKRAHILFGCGAIFFAYYAYMSNRKKTRVIRVFGIAIGALVCLFVIANFIPALSTFMVRFMETAESGDVTLGRTALWEIAIEKFKISPIFGIGWGNYISQNIYGWHTHNIYFQLLCETGILGFTAYVSFFVYSLISAWKAMVVVRKSENPNDIAVYYLLISIAIQLFFLMYGFTGNPLYEKEMYLPYFVACAIPRCVKNDYRLRKRKEEMAV